MIGDSSTSDAEPDGPSPVDGWRPRERSSDELPGSRFSMRSLFLMSTACCAICALASYAHFLWMPVLAVVGAVACFLAASWRRKFDYFLLGVALLFLAALRMADYMSGVQR